MSIPREYLRQTYHYDIPDASIAQEPLPVRDQSKLLERKANGGTSHQHFYDLPKLLPEGSVLVINESRVIPARLYGQKESGAAVEIFLIEEIKSGKESSTWSCLGRPMKKLKEGSKVYFANGLSAHISKEAPSSADQILPCELCFDKGSLELSEWLHSYAKMPLPPYIKRAKEKNAQDILDAQRYQTVYSTSEGSVAAATAGLHFTDNVFAKLEAKAIQVVRVCLHVGAGTFLPVKTEDIREHIMHEERYSVPKQTLAACFAAKKANKPVIAVGTTSLRSLESISALADYDESKALDLCDRMLRTSIFIHPKEEATHHDSWLCDAILTNFHQPESSLFMLVSALIGIDEAHAMYGEAIAKNYRFFSYGDSSLLWL